MRFKKLKISIKNILHSTIYKKQNQNIINTLIKHYQIILSSLHLHYYQKQKIRTVTAY